MRRRTALAIGVAALVAGTSAGVIMARSDDGDQRATPTNTRTTPGDPGRGSGPGTTRESGGIEPGGVLVDVDGVRTIEYTPQGGLLVSYPSCSDFLQAVNAVAVQQVGPWGWQGNGYGGQILGGAIEEEFAVADSDVVSEAAPPAASPPAAEPSVGAARGAAPSDLSTLEADTGLNFSVTNVQERGIDEPDIVKTDGRTIWVVAQSYLFAIDATGPEPRLLDRLELDTWGAQLLLDADRLLVIGLGGFTPFLPVEPGIEPGLIEPSLAEPDIAPYGGTGTSLKLVDVSQPDRLKLIETLNVEGGFITARLTGESVRLVTSSFPRPCPSSIPTTTASSPSSRPGSRTSASSAGSARPTGCPSTSVKTTSAARARAVSPSAARACGCPSRTLASGCSVA